MEQRRYEDAKCLRATPKALLVNIGDGEERWIPVKCITDDSEVYDADENADGTLCVAEWFAVKEDWP